MYGFQDRTPKYINDKYTNSAGGCVVHYLLEYTNLNGNPFTASSTFYQNGPPTIVSQNTVGSRQILYMTVTLPKGPAAPFWVLTDSVTSEQTNTYYITPFECEDMPSTLVSLQNATKTYYSNQIGYFAKFKFDVKYSLTGLVVSSNYYDVTYENSIPLKLGEYIASIKPKVRDPPDQRDISIIDFTVTNSITSTVVYSHQIPSFIQNTSSSVSNNQFSYPNSGATVPCNFYQFVTVQGASDSDPYFGMLVANNIVGKENRIAYGNPSITTMIYDTPIIAPTTQYSTFFYYKNFDIQMSTFTTFEASAPTTTNPFSTSVVTYGPESSVGPTALYVCQFSTQNLVNIGPISFQYNGVSLTLPFSFPMSIESGTYKTNTQMEISIAIPIFNGGTFTLLGSTFTASLGVPDTSLPQLVDFKWISLGGQKYILEINVIDWGSGFYAIEMFSGYNLVAYLDFRDIVSGTNSDGVYQKFYDFLNLKNPFRPIDKIMLYDMASNVKKYIQGYYDFNPIPVISNYVENIVQNYNLYDVTSVRFAFNDIDVSSTGAQNAIYFNISNANKDSGVAIKFFINVRNTDPYKYVFYGKWHEPSGMFSINFELPSRIFTGQVEYSIWYPDLFFTSINLFLTLGESSQLRVKSKNSYAIPPYLFRLTSIPATAFNVPISGAVETGWSLSISDGVGVKKMIITVFSDVDGSDFNQTYSLTKSNEVVNVTWSVTTPCITQTYRIKYLYLENSNGVFSEYRYGKASNGISPFMQVMNSNQFEITATCPYFNDLTTPNMKSVVLSSPSSIVINSGQRDFSISFCVEDMVSCINSNPRYLPYCVFNGILSQRFQVRATQVNSTSTMGCFKCTGVFPYMFGSPFNNDNLFLSIYGYTDALMNFGGISSFSLSQNVNYVSRILITNSLNKVPVIEGATKLTNLGGDLTVYGHNFGTNTSSVSARVITSVDPILYSVSYVENVVAVIKGIQANLHHLEVVIVVGFESSNTFIVPIENELVVPYTPPIIPTQCPGTPLCGGPNNGDCIANKCQCKDPWIGNDCLSQNIIIKPIINTTSPDTGNDYKADLDGKDVSLKTLVSIVSLNEINKDSSINFSYNFTNWKYTNITSSDRTKNFEEYLYETDVPYGGINTTVKVTLKYFHNKDTVEFAGEIFDILPSTLKYQISISPFKFQSSLNTLQLVMSASIQSDTNDYSCTYQEQGNSPDSDADYVKLQVNEHSLYGRFIKRAIIDNRIQTISNTFQNGESQSTHIQNQVAINIPNFQYLVIMDPDYSVLIDSQKASDQSTSTCGQPSEDKGLTKTQLIGIIIGSVAIGIIAIVIGAFLLYKKNSTIRVIALKLKPKK
ncbi:EGF-like domain-containing protein [Tieghemostelium lacteum]|uniref:EGF-like domain-containing protein n=1 Tax=Tieghemostelium lacteum TaxID=361077 RepID=A0A151ZCV0_TIELA|nr:EGF-like domain-containing protein [Tieghemostelium lacteum]|eukprot:KYQ91777.1 EGF-like domain-containing protein [Tieghemostelium lacteum]